jgi:hypothetical protein
MGDSGDREAPGTETVVDTARTRREVFMGENAGSDAGQQRFAALKRANGVRLARAELKRQICRGELSAADVVESCPSPAYKMPVSEVLMSQRRWGIQRCRRVLVPIGIPENKEVGTLTDRQRAALVATLDGGRQRRESAQPAPTPRPPRPLTPGHARALPARAAREPELSAV